MGGFRFGAILVIAAFLTGCGGAGSIAVGTRGDVSGLVVDPSGYVVPGAKIVADPEHSTVSNTVGVYLLQDLPAIPTSIKAQVTRQNVQLAGESQANVAAGARIKDVNITVFPNSSP